MREKIKNASHLKTCIFYINIIYTIKLQIQKIFSILNLKELGKST